MKNTPEWLEDHKKCIQRFRDRGVICVMIPSGLYPAGTCLSGNETAALVKQHPEGGGAACVYDPEQKAWIVSDHAVSKDPDAIVLQEASYNRYGHLQNIASIEDDEYYVARKTDDQEKIRFRFRRGSWILTCSGKLKHIEKELRFVINVKTGLSYLIDPVPEAGRGRVRVRTLSMNAVTHALPLREFGSFDLGRMIRFIKITCRGFGTGSAYPLPDESSMHTAAGIPEKEAQLAALNRFFYGLRYPFPLPEGTPASQWVMRYALKGLKREMSPMETFERMAKNLGLKNSRLFRRTITDPEHAPGVVMLSRMGFRDMNVISETEKNCIHLRAVARHQRPYGENAFRVFRKLMRDIIRRKGEPAAARLLRNCRDDHMLIDTAMMYAALTQGGFQPSLEGDLKRIHDRLMREQKLLRLGPPREIPYDAWERDLESSFCGVDFVLPKSTHDLAEIGSRMNDCVGSYADRALSGQCTIVAMMRDTKVAGCIELDAGRRLVQAKGVNNGILEGTLFDALGEWVRIKGIGGTDTCRDYLLAKRSA